MARRYEIDELLWLRSSPLVAKPPGLPPIEEWMPLPEPTTQRKTQTSRDPNSPETTSNRRPSLFEARHTSRGSNSEDIVLGPPKTAFASSRIGGKGSFDLTDRTPRPAESDETRNDRFNFKDRFPKDREPQDRDFERRDGRQGALNGRRGEREDWNAGRPPRRTFGVDEPDRKPRRNGEFDRWEGRETPRDPNPNTERGTRDKEGRFVPRRDGPPGRARHEGRWFRDETANANEALEGDDEKSHLRSREWRRDRHGADREWNRGARFEQDPEWMDSTDHDEPRRAHTQEDFERWKERMKAGSSQPAPTQAEERSEPSEQQPDARRTDGEIFSHSGAPFMSDSSMERFFGLLGDAKSAPPAPPAPPPQEVSTPNSIESAIRKEALAGKAGKSSRFAGLFSPPPEMPTKEPDPHAGTQSPAGAMGGMGGMAGMAGLGGLGGLAGLAGMMPPGSHDADQEGFQRILQMLGGGRSNNGTPQQNEHSQHSRPSSLVHADQPRTGATLSSPPRESHPRSEYMGPSPEQLMAQGGGKDPQAREREHLLRLMQQVRVGPAPSGNPQSPNAYPAPPPGLVPEGLPRPPGLHVQKTPVFLDDPAIANMQRPDSEQFRRRAANGPPPGYFDDVPFPPGNQGPITPGGSRPPNAPPMGLQRPPGLEGMPPPGWAGQLPPQQGNGPSPMGPPPGIPAPNRGMLPNFPPGMMPMPGNAPPINDRQAFPRGPPPGMMPPPGFMNGPLPSGFPPMPPNPEMMGMGPGNQGPFGPGSSGPQGPPSSRHLLEMFGQSNGGDARGGMVGPGQYR
ncbi:uncharacterized protein PFLUO_LOCUS4795 [Penicillium psychrofluorescens]|uniref:uncharacterized protein n=1 Tax=Penicillium psychrofluorescens TaxID=3158075 RepID=UPI003CCDCED0